MDSYPKPTKVQVAKAALTRPPSRQSDQIIYWWIKGTKELGFPIMICFILLYIMFWKMPEQTERTTKIENGLNQVTSALSGMSEATKTLVEKADELESASDTIRGIVIGKFKCPDLRCPRCPEIRCPPMQVQAVQPVQPKAASTNKGTIADPNLELKSVEIPMPNHVPYSGQ